MSCGTLNAQAVQLNVTIASLPEGFCPSNFQDLANAIGDRILITPSSNFNTFAIGPSAPASNVGPWLKDCSEWFVFDDATAAYIPIRRGFDSLQYFSTAGAQNFIVPANIFKIKVTAIGGGGGGFSDGTSSATGSGGGGAFGVAIKAVTPGQTIPLVIGAGGSAGSPGTAGGASTVLGMTANGGLGGTSVTVAGVGGAATGFDINLSGQSGQANTTGGATNSDSQGGSAGGWGGGGGTTSSGASSVGRSGVAPGGGGSGSSNAATVAGGAGAAGAILIEY